MTLPTPAIFADFTTNSYIFNNSYYPSFSSLLSALAGSFSRASVAYSTNASGLLTQAGNNVLRFDYNPLTLASRGILLEGSSTNLYVQSNNFSVSWNNIGSPTLTQNVTGPDGISNSAWTFASTSTNINFIYQSPSAIVGSGTSYTASFYAKAGLISHAYIEFNDNGANDIGVWFDLNAGAVGSTVTIAGSPAYTAIGAITPASNGWYRCAVTISQASGTSTLALVALGFSDADASRTLTSGNTGSMWGAQFEALGFASSYIPTASGSAPRQADVLQFPNNLSTTTLYVESFGLIQTGRLIGGPGAAAPIFLNNLTTSFGTYNAVNAALNATLGSGTFGGTAKTAVAGNASSRSVIGDNGTIQNDSNALFGAAITPLYIGTDANSDASFGNFLQFGAWNFIFSNSQLQTVTDPNTTLSFIIPDTTLTRAGRYFSRRDYLEWLARIVAENKATERQREELIAAVEAERNLTDIERADRDYNNAEEEYGKSEVALFNNLTSTNHIKFSEAKERRAKARKERDHHYYMEVVKKAWADHDAKSR